MQHTDKQTPFTKKSMEWVSNHMALAKWICNPNEPIPPDVLQAELEKAILTQDHAYYGLLLYQQELQNNPSTSPQEHGRI